MAPWHGAVHVCPSAPHSRMEYTVWEFPLFICMGILGGLVGGLFCNANKKLTQQRRKWLRPPKFGKKGKVILGRAISGISFCGPLEEDHQ